ncbi:MAG: helix-turn-helix transcriptional regulator [Ramlibacter sp.]
MNPNQIAHIAALVGEPARTGMLLALMDGRALTGHELATAGHISPATASRHLQLLAEAGLLRVERQGRHRYHRLASVEVARVLEGIMQLAAQAGPRAQRVATGPRDAAMQLARTCYDHLAGRIAVAVADQLIEQAAVVIEDDTAVVTDAAGAALEGLGLRSELVYARGPGQRPPCRPCLDWGERRMHLAGRLGAVLCSHCLQMGWLLQMPRTRALELTPRGAVAFRDWLGMERWRTVTQTSSCDG